MKTITMIIKKMKDNKESIENKELKFYNIRDTTNNKVFKIFLELEIRKYLSEGYEIFLIKEDEVMLINKKEKSMISILVME